MATGAIKAKYLILESTPPSSVPNGSFFYDSTNNDNPTVKTPTGIINALQGSSQAQKMMIADGSVALYAPLSKKPNGKVILADSDNIGTQQVIGFAMAAGNNGDLVPVLMIGPNIAGALSGLNFNTGDEIYVSETGGYTNDANSLTGANDSVIRVGIADCAAATASTTATDLIVSCIVVLRPLE